MRLLTVSALSWSYIDNMPNARNMNNIKVSKPVFKIISVDICLINYQFHVGLQQIDALFSLHF